MQMFVTLELSRTINTDHAVVVCAKTAGLTRTATLYFHRCFKSRFINFQITLTANIGSQVNRETEGVIQTESSFAIQSITLSF